MIHAILLTGETMKYLATLILLSASIAGATSVRDYESKTIHERTEIVSNFLDKMIADIRVNNPQLASEIHDWFNDVPAGKPIPEGLEKFEIELGALDMRAKEGRADLSKVQVEGVIVYVVKQKFAPQLAKR